MSLGERAALEGLLAQIRPRLSIEIGTAEGGSLDRIAAYSDEVHAFDLYPPQAAQPQHVHLHIGDSKKTLPELLDRLASEGRNVDFALVDGDHTTEGVTADLVNLLASPAVERTVIVLHDTMNESVRIGLRDARLESIPKVSYVELDFLPGYMARQGEFADELWGGLGLVLVNASGGRWRGDSVYDDHRFDAYEMIRRMGGSFSADGTSRDEDAESYGVRRIQALSDELHRLRGILDEMHRSMSWRMTEPLRALKRSLRR
jgi:Methyltransferase domain